jgi:hypothetical protein
MSHPVPKHPASGQHRGRKTRVLSFPAVPSTATEPGETVGNADHLSEVEQTSALQIAGYVGRLLVARGPKHSA